MPVRVRRRFQKRWLAFWFFNKLLDARMEATDRFSFPHTSVLNFTRSLRDGCGLHTPKNKKTTRLQEIQSFSYEVRTASSVKEIARRKRMGRKQYEKELRKLQVELCKLQAWVKSAGQRIIVVFEGRDGAGKGGTIKAITERVSPRVFRVVALPAPSDREKTQLYLQRYLACFPAAGEIVIFDRSWYNRAGVEYVMGFCSEKQHQRFLSLCPAFEETGIVEDGIILIKFWLEVSRREQERRFKARMKDPLRQWKLSPMDLPSRSRWYAYSRARDTMLESTDTEAAPWHIVPADDKRRARLNCIAHLLNLIPYKQVPTPKVRLPKISKKGAYDDDAAMKRRRFVPEKF